MRREMGKKPPRKEMDEPSFLWRHMAGFWDTLKIYPKGIKMILDMPKNMHCSLGPQFIKIFSTSKKYLCWMYSADFVELDLRDGDCSVNKYKG